MRDSIILMTITLQPPYKDHPSDRLTFFPKKGTGFLANPYVIISDGPPEWQKKGNGQRRSAPCQLVMDVSTLLCPQQALWGLVDKT